MIFLTKNFQTMHIVAHNGTDETVCSVHFHREQRIRTSAWNDVHSLRKGQASTPLDGRVEAFCPRNLQKMVIEMVIIWRKKKECGSSHSLL